MLDYFGKILIFLGVFFILGGFILILGEKVSFLGKLPGDIYWRKGNFTFYFPLTSFLILSVLVSLIFNLILRIFRR